MKVEQSFTIDGNVVTETGIMNGFKTFTYFEFSEAVIYFVNSDNEVVGNVKVIAEMGQGTGYVGSVEAK